MKMIRELLTDLRYAFTRDQIDTLILFITNRCNLKCYFCFYADNLNTTKDLPFEAYAKMAGSLPSGVRSLLISGGEPFLREDIDKVLLEFTRKCGTRFINVPTNGSFTKNTVEKVTSFLDQEKNAFLTISFSLDGFKEIHDEVRRQAGSFDKAVATLSELIKLKARYPNLRLQVSTVACRENMDRLDEFVDYIRQNYPIDYHNIEVQRVGMPNIHAVPAIREINAKFIAACDKVSRYYLLEKKDNAVYPFISQSLSRWITRAHDLSRMTIDEELIERGKPWPVGCLAGRTICVVDANGDYRACELRNPLFNLKEVDYDLSAALKAEKNIKETAAIGEGKCFCTHGCFLAASQRRYPSTFLYRWWGYLAQDLLGRGVIRRTRERIKAAAAHPSVPVRP
jgi:MoaA/NifB/PqqE/SkfB family radical SAM enzyme